MEWDLLLDRKTLFHEESRETTEIDETPEVTVVVPARQPFDERYADSGETRRKGHPVVNKDEGASQPPHFLEERKPLLRLHLVKDHSG